MWTCTNPNSDPDMKNDANVLEDSYEDCLKRLYGKYVEVEVLLPRATTASDSSGSSGGPPPSVVYRVPIQSGHVNRMGMVSKSRATVTLYPRGRTLAGGDAAKAAGAKKDLAIPLGLTNVHLPLGPGLVDPGWAKGKKLFWKGRSMGLV